MDQTQLLLETVIKGLQEKKGHGIIIVDLNKIPGAICQYMVICEGNNPTQIASLSESVLSEVNKELKEKPLSTDGMHNAQWIGMDYASVLVHIFLPEMRSFYRLENLWEDAEIKEIPDLD